MEIADETGGGARVVFEKLLGMVGFLKRKPECRLWASPFVEDMRWLGKIKINFVFRSTCSIFAGRF